MTRPKTLATLARLSPTRNPVQGHATSWYGADGAVSVEFRAQRAPEVGEVVAGRYEIVGEIGAGGMGRVYEARHTFTARRIALKLLHPVASTPALVGRFLREAQAWTAIGHPGIVEVIDAGHTDEGTPYLALEFLEGRTLGSLVDETPIDTSLAAHIGLRVLDALGAAHAQGFVHRDVKPDNVFILQSEDPRAPRIKLLDFGIAHRLDPVLTGITAPNSVLGTLEYMSPEQAAGRAIDARTDLWSLGATLYHAVSGRPPFAATNLNALLLEVAGGDHEPVANVAPGISPELAHVIEHALIKDLDRRYRSASAMAEALLSVASGARESVASDPSISLLPEPRASKRPSVRALAPWIAIGTLGLAIALIIAWRATDPGRADPPAERRASTAHVSPPRAAADTEPTIFPDGRRFGVQHPPTAEVADPVRAPAPARVAHPRARMTTDTPESPAPVEAGSEPPSPEATTGARAGDQHRAGGLAREDF
jgi:serine/threonine protein kinase